VPRDADRNYVIVRGPDADRHVKLLIQFAVEGSLSSAFSHPTGKITIGDAASWRGIDEKAIEKIDGTGVSGLRWYRISGRQAARSAGA